MVRAQAVFLVLAFVCGCSKGTHITVGSKNFTEQVLLGEIVAQHLEHSMGVEVDRKLNLGGTLLAHEATKAGSIDIYPEYTGTALTAVLKQSPSTKADDVFKTVQSEYQKQWGLTWLPPLGFENTFAMVVRNDAGIRSLSEAVTSSKPWRLGVGYEFLKRPDGLEGAASYRLAGEDAEPRLDQVEPRGALRGEMEVDAGMGREPRLHRRGRMRGGVVQDDVQLVTAVATSDALEEREKIGPGVPLAAFSQDLAAGDLERGVQAGQPVAAVVVGLARRQPGPQRQQRLRPAQRLDLGLLVDTQHHGIRRRIEIQPHHIVNLRLRLVDRW